MSKPQKHVFVCTQNRPQGHPRGACSQKGCSAVFDEFMKQMQQRNLWEKISVTYSGCLGPCSQGTSVVVYPEAVMYGKVTPADVAAIFDEHLVNNQVVERLRVPADVWG